MIGVVASIEQRDIVREFFELFKTPWEFWRRRGRYDVVIHADGELEETPARLVIVYGGQMTACDHRTGSLPGQPRRRATLSWTGERIPIYGSCVTFQDDGRSPGLVLEDTGEPVVSVTRTGAGAVVRIGYDLFREIRFLLETGQPPAHAAIPTLERHIAFLRSAIVNSGVPLVEIPPIPEGYRFIACLTHDVDHPSILLHRFDHTMFGFLYRAVVGSVFDVCSGKARPTTLLRNWAAAVKLPFVHARLAADFWSGFERYLEIEKGLGSTFFVIPVKNDPGRTVEARAPRLRASAYGVSDIADRVKGLRASGCEVALHGIDAWLDTSRGWDERSHVSGVTGASTTGVRMHWLYFDERAPERLEAAGFTYDSTFGYNDTVGFRAGTMQAFRPPAATRLLELPLTLMDTALFYPSYMNLTAKAAKDVVWPLVDNAERYGGALTVNWHDRSLAPERLWDTFYVELVQELKRRAAWFPTATQAASWFHRRRSAVFECAHSEGASVRIRSAADSTAPLPGLTVRMHTPGPPDGDPARWRRSTPYTDVPLRDTLDTRVSAGEGP